MTIIKSVYLNSSTNNKFMHSNHRKLYRYILISFLGLILFSSFKKDYFEVSKQLDIFATLFKELNIYYIDDTEPDKLMNKAIRSMLETLDPYTTYLSEEEAENFKTHTTGEYAGIGAAIKKHEDDIIVFQIYEGFAADKAGIKAGDILLEIDGNIMEGKSTREVSSILKGSLGTTTSVKIIRPNVEGTLNLNIKREKITVKSVPYFGMVNSETGYIVLNSFSRKATLDVSNAFGELKKLGMKSLILDFRDNPGGLLSQAVEVSNIFLAKKTLIVETRGKIEEWNRKHYTQIKAKDEKIPIVLLTNYGTASASEIVAGAFQDLDRAVIMGSRTYGKGLVQQPRDLTYGTQLKITIAKYYIPSGRSIQARDYFDRNDDGSVRVIADSLRVKYKTRAGRIVFDGGGILPDIEVEDDTLSPYSKFLMGENLFFEYSVKFCNSISNQIDINNFELKNEDLQDFNNFIIASNKVYKSKLDAKIIELRNLAEKEDVLKTLNPSIQELETKMKIEHKNIFEKNKEQINKLLSLTIINNKYYERGRYMYNLKHDNTISQATILLKDKVKYNNIISKN
ncbi:MAG: S41 family peptidase [Flavobacteriales bacterium]|nr:S41 family peptidase [Flavobacteriales bacterium]